MQRGFQPSNSLSRKNSAKCHNLTRFLRYGLGMMTKMTNIPKDFRRSEQIRLCLMMGLSTLVYLKIVALG
jgi:hypothetical protein